MGELKILNRDRLNKYRKSVRVYGIRRGTFIEFEFTVEFKELTIELVMPYDAFKEFCETNHVSEISCSEDVEPAFKKMAIGGLPKLFKHEEDCETTSSDAQSKDENIIQLGDFK